MMKKAYFFIDDTICVLRDITRQKPASLFDNPFMKMLKDAHDKYGLKVQLNLFYRTDYFYGNDEFSLRDVTDAYKSEFESSSDWLKLAYHAKQEFPDYPHVNAKYEDVKSVFNAIEKEVFRFAGKNSFAYTVDPHWDSTSTAGVQALADCGVKLLYATYGNVSEYNGDPESLPYGHAARLLNNRQPEARVFTRLDGGEDIASSVCAYNHLEEDVAQSILRDNTAVYDDAFDIYMKPFSEITLNLYPCDQLEKIFAPELDWNYVGVCVHEQYFYPDYFAYQPDYADKIFKMCEILTNAGFTFVCGEDIIK